MAVGKIHQCAADLNLSATGRNSLFGQSPECVGDLFLEVQKAVAMHSVFGPGMYFIANVVVLQELKAPDAKFPAKAIETAGYGAVWHGQKSWNGVAILSRGQEPHLTRKGLPGEPEDEQSRYIEAIVDGVVIGGLYLPNGNPYPGPKFDYKLRWFQRLHDYAAELLELEVPVVLVGDYNVMPTELDVYKPERWTDDALFRVKDGLMRCAKYIPESVSTHSGTISEMPMGATRV